MTLAVNPRSENLIPSALSRHEQHACFFSREPPAQLRAERLVRGPPPLQVRCLNSRKRVRVKTSVVISDVLGILLGDPDTVEKCLCCLPPVWHNSASSYLLGEFSHFQSLGSSRTAPYSLKAVRTYRSAEY